ncbi:MAG: hypothetical protein CO093_05305 [Alphaproteobacteria bacterium CG_4_9_14_3_um_filter_47_13]|nr:MAG: hypothetical protein CO093_05305 [Alphaproteobacteria bacterium CG_4_9_14_3_um_filter_47_13]
MLKNKRFIFLALLYAAIIVTGFFVAYRAWTVHKVMAGLHDVSFGQYQGAENADKTIVEFLDYRCNYCRQMHPVMMQVLERHPDVRIIYRHYPIFGRPSLIEAEIALAAGMHGKFRQAHDYLITREDPITDREIEELATKLGINIEQFRLDMKDQQMGYLLLGTLDAIEALNIRSVPTFMVGNILYSLEQGMPDVETFDRLLAEAYGE